MGCVPYLPAIMEPESLNFSIWIFLSSIPNVCGSKCRRMWDAARKRIARPQWCLSTGGEGGGRRFEEATRALAFNERRCSFTSSSTLKNNASAKSTSGRSHQEVKNPKDACALGMNQRVRFCDMWFRLKCACSKPLALGLTSLRQATFWLSIEKESFMVVLGCSYPAPAWYHVPSPFVSILSLHLSMVLAHHCWRPTVHSSALPTKFLRTNRNEESMISSTRNIATPNQLPKLQTPSFNTSLKSLWSSTELSARITLT